jgi:hypothetical protein
MNSTFHGLRQNQILLKDNINCIIKGIKTSRRLNFNTPLNTRFTIILLPKIPRVYAKKVYWPSMMIKTHLRYLFDNIIILLIRIVIYV